MISIKDCHLFEFETVTKYKAFLLRLTLHPFSDNFLIVMKNCDRILASLLAFLINLVIKNFNVQASDLVKLSPEECKSLGFLTSDLTCSRCVDLKNFDLREIETTCRQCCQEEAVKPSTLHYARAELVVCRCNLHSYPAIKEFMDRHLDEYPNVSVTYERGVHPTLRLYTSEDDDESSADEKNIAKWQTHHVREFLDSHLKD